MSKTTLAIAAVILVSALSATSAAGGSNSIARSASDPLVGTWDTGPFPSAKLRTALLNDGYTRSAVRTLFKNLQIGKVYEFNLVFYRQDGVPFQAQTGWDPSKGSKPSDGDHGPYKLLAHHRFTVSGVDPPTDKIHTTYSYAVTTTRLKLRFIRLTEPFPAAQRRLDRMFPIATALLPYKKIS
jgi:hypothetical protein